MSERLATWRPEVVIHAEQVFEPVAARIVTRVLAGTTGPSLVSLDFHRCRYVDACALALLAQAIANAHDAEIELRGLSRHHERVLKYFGLELRSGPAGLGAGFVRS